MQWYGDYADALSRHEKGQITVASRLRKHFDIVDSAGALSKLASAEHMIEELLESRKKGVSIS
ncbi:MAG: hypothetical protein JRN20_05115 [Nitrososphaerota archaeon]|jgi:hypothetical protein|nr:hypothetical protein [Nitrososphaerota archaeon]MDG6922471.1 hypothetical protein [Nitrososphaerota archaeon]